ncbi:hypothetical protein BKA69DRAFT_1081361 [Paraphysoderma sedebokerense]|nr:hypothetical protein BKA69DRAFT_1081361 [Paraphysoderma sedebokerense]
MDSSPSHINTFKKSTFSSPASSPTSPFSPEKNRLDRSPSTKSTQISTLSSRRLISPVKNDTQGSSIALCSVGQPETVTSQSSTSSNARSTKLVPASAMYWKKVTTYGKRKPKPLRAHTMNIVGDKILIFGGSDLSDCTNDVFLLDPYTMTWKAPKTSGELPPPVRAHTSSVVDKRLFIFGGGNGPTYFNQIYILDTETFIWKKPECKGDIPCHRRAHSSCTYNNKIYIIFGGDGVKALGDVYVFDTDPNSYTWTRINASGNPPIARGYHTTTLVGSKLYLFGGSDGHECFHDMHVLDIESNSWSTISTMAKAVPRLSHTAALVGPYIFIFGGHDGSKYSTDMLMFNLATQTFETRPTRGIPPSGRGYCTSILYDSRVFVYGGYDGQQVFDDLYVLELGVWSYLEDMCGAKVMSAVANSKR